MIPIQFRVAAASIAAIALALPAQAETLREALAAAYASNPTLTAERAGLRATDENVVIAKSRGRPGLDVTGTYTENLERAQNSFTSPARFVAGRASFDVPIFAGGAVKYSIRGADKRVEVGQADLRSTEAQVFSNVVAAYMDVLRDEAIVELNRNLVKVLTTNLQATTDRFEVGDLTRTDIAQSESRLARAQSGLQLAEANLISSRERYIQQVGHVPGKLDEPPVLPNLPGAVDPAVGEALADNPSLIAANKLVDAARFDIKVAEAGRLPKVQGVAQGDYTNFLGSLGSGVPGVSLSQSQRSASAGIQLQMPLYQGGAPAAQVRQAQARTSQAIEIAIATERAIVAQTRSAFASWQAANATIRSAEKGVSAAKLALEGVRAENSVGTRTILDILDAEQELLNAQVDLVTARRNAYVAGFSLLALMGKGEAADLGLDGGPLYDPQVNYNRVRNRWGDWGDDPDPKPVATRTVDTQAQNPSLSQ